MLRTYYQQGAFSALVDAGIIKQAVLGEILAGVPAVAKSFAMTKAKGYTRRQIADTTGTPTPEWREAGGKFDIPLLAAQRAMGSLQKAWKQPVPVIAAPEEAELPVVKLDL